MAPSRGVRCATRASSVPRSGGSSRPVETRGRATQRREVAPTGEKEAACGARVVAHPSVQRADGQGRTILRLSPAGRPDAEQELGSQRSAEREPATQSTGTPAAALAPERAVPKANVEPEALASLGMLG